MTKTFSTVSALILLVVISGCANMNHRQRNTAVGATAGGVLGAVLTDGDPLATVGGAAVGGLVGYKTTPSSHRRHK
jgi:osmotically inducible lipoprotein OsmB